MNVLFWYFANVAKNRLKWAENLAKFGEIWQKVSAKCVEKELILVKDCSYFVFFVRSGVTGTTYINNEWVAANAINGIGRDSYYWPHSAFRYAISAHGLIFNDNTIWPQYTQYRYYGQSLRCLYAS